MTYHLDLDALDLNYLKARLMEEDLVPSQLPLREGFVGNAARLEEAGFSTLGGLSAAISKKGGLSAVAGKTGIPEEYLKLLGRALRGYKPQPRPLAEFPGIDPGILESLARAGIMDSKELYEAAASRQHRAGLSAETGVAAEALHELLCLADLSRIQWLSPVYARILFEAGYDSVAAVSRALPEELHRRVSAANESSRLYRGTIGLRDMGRLVFLASQLTRFATEREER